MNDEPLKFKRAYIEITNVCNLNCSFCPGTVREKKFMTPDEFRTVCEKIKGYTEYIYLHVMGEPLIHPELEKILGIGSEFGYHINITTNGTLLKEKVSLLSRFSAVRKVSVSLHSFEGNGLSNIDEYLENIWDFCLETDSIVTLRLWNGGGADSLNEHILSYFSVKSGVEIDINGCNSNGFKIGEKIYIEPADKFDWPSIDAGVKDVSYCYGMITQFAVLCDGTVVPCCLDCDGNIKLGNIFSDNFGDVLASERVSAIRNGFRCRKPAEELCRHCGYAERF